MQTGVSQWLLCRVLGTADKVKFLLVRAESEDHCQDLSTPHPTPRFELR